MHPAPTRQVADPTSDPGKIQGPHAKAALEQQRPDPGPRPSSDAAGAHCPGGALCRTNGYTGTHVQTSSLSSTDEKLSARTGLVYKPTENGRFYVAWSNSFNPSAENLASNGGGLSAATENLAPEKNETWELGTKWELLDKRVELDAALFRVEKTNARETMADGSTQLTGKQRVQGFELGVTGRVTELWDVFANYTFLDSEILDAANTPAGNARKGQPLGNTPPHSFNLWTTYELPAVGYGARYASKRNVTSSTTAKLDAYWLHNAMVGYRVNDDLDLQLNVNNLFNKDYVERDASRTVTLHAPRRLNTAMRAQRLLRRPTRSDQNRSYPPLTRGLGLGMPPAPARKAGRCWAVGSRHKPLAMHCPGSR